MSAETQLYSALTGNAGLASLIATRIYPDAIPEDESLPAVVFIRASTDPTYTIGGILICEDVHFALTVWSTTRALAEAIADQMTLVVQGAYQQILDRSAGFDGDVGLYSATLDINWFYQ